MTLSSPIRLHSDRLEVEIAQPGSAYAGTRFDWSGFITQVTLDGSHTFCVPEDYTPGKGTGGIGLCNEFGIDMPVGFSDTQPGDCFPKLGIGLLTRLDKPDYSFWYPHQVARPFPIQVESGPDSATFTVQPIDCRGYAARLVKTLSVSANHLIIQYTLENTGSRPIQTNEYVHNFVGVNIQNIGPDYILRFPQAVELESTSLMTAILLPEDNKLTLRSVPQTPFYCRLTGLLPSDQPQWTLVHTPSGLTMSERVDFSPSRIAVWGTTHVISVEVFYDINLQPGESTRWQRQYEFAD
jgi:hypothetical protein